MKKITLYDPIPDMIPDPLPLPTELLAIASLLDKDYEIKIFDFRSDKEEVIKQAKESICFGLTCLTGFQISDGLEVAKAVRKVNPKVPLVWGGWHPSLSPEQTIKNEYVDIIVRGQGERTFYELVKAIDKGKSLKEIKGITYKKDGKILHNIDRPLEDLNNFPRLPYYLVDVNRYINKTDFGKRTMTYVSSRGCPYNCAFCADPALYHRRWFTLDTKRVLDDLNFLKKKYNIDSVYFPDNNFFVSEKRVVEIAKGLTKLGLRWGNVAGRVDNFLRFSEETWKVFEKSRLHSLSIGGESGIDEIQKWIDKRINVEEIVKLYGLVKKYNIGMLGSFVIGFPHKKYGVKEQFNETLNLMYRIWKINPSGSRFWLFVYQPYPQNPLFDKSKEFGFVPPDSFEEWASFGQFETNVPWVNKKYSKLVRQVRFYFRVASGTISNNLMSYPTPFRQFLGISEYLFRRSIGFRLKRRIFAFPIEYHLLSFVANTTKKFVENEKKNVVKYE